MSPPIDDPRLVSPQCNSLNPVRTVHENPWFSVRDRGGFYSVEYNCPQVVVLPILDERFIILVRAKRPLIDDSTLELPAGGARPNETPVQAAARELAEETGIEIQDLTRFQILPPLSVTPRYPFLVYIFQVNVLHAEYDLRHFHDDEIVSVECLSFDEIRRLIVAGEIYIALPIAILGKFLLSNCANL